MNHRLCKGNKDIRSECGIPCMYIHWIDKEWYNSLVKVKVTFYYLVIHANTLIVYWHSVNGILSHPMIWYFKVRDLVGVSAISLLHCPVKPLYCLQVMECCIFPFRVYEHTIDIFFHEMSFELNNFNLLLIGCLTKIMDSETLSCSKCLGKLLSWLSIHNDCFI